MHSELGDLQRQKQLVRENFTRQGIVSSDWAKGGKAAELLRRELCYQAADLVFVDPSPQMQQVRINCLLDGKELIMPGPGLKEGFYRFLPNTIAFRDLSYAVTIKGLTKYAGKLSRADLAGLRISLLITGALAADACGGRLGDGHGFFDLSHAIFAMSGTLKSDAKVVTLVSSEQIVADPLPRACWDVSADMIFTEEKKYVPVDVPSPAGRIFWEYLDERKIRKITPLWWLWGEKREGFPTGKKSG
ncbi:MAG: 5-formyltetrahydrofolate cyclo-ligase [Pseudomonadota bacterium]